MASDRKQQAGNSIPIRFVDEDGTPAEAQVEIEDDDLAVDSEEQADVEPDAESKSEDTEKGGPALAELIASRAELKRLQTALVEAQDTATRRQADFENYRKRTERERGETYNRLVGDVVRKLLPVVDNLDRALEAERSMQANESKEFRHFLHGVELISKQLAEVMKSFGVEVIPAVGERFDPYIHEAVVTEPSDKYEPDTVTEELARGYRIGDKLLRPAMVKVAAHPTGE